MADYKGRELTPEWTCEVFNSKSQAHYDWWPFLDGVLVCLAITFRDRTWVKVYAMGNAGEVKFAVTPVTLQ